MGGPETDPSELTALLVRWGDGDGDALSKLTPIIYQELRSLAGLYMRQERPDHTLQPTALVHELFIRLFDVRNMDWRSRGHFFGVASKLMRRVLVDHARKKQASKRTGADPLADGLLFAAAASEEEILAIDQALRKLEFIDPRKAHVVERKYFGGMTNEETADSLSVSLTTVQRDWCMAKAWLYRELKGGGPRA